MTDVGVAMEKADAISAAKQKYFMRRTGDGWETHVWVEDRQEFLVRPVKDFAHARRLVRALRVLDAWEAMGYDHETLPMFRDGESFEEIIDRALGSSELFLFPEMTDG